MLLQTARRIWDRLTAPHPFIQDIERRRQSRLLANFILLILLFQFLSLGLALNGNLPASGVGNSIIVIFVGTVVYLLNRNMRYLLAAHILVFIAFVITHLSLITQSRATIFYSAVVVLASTMLVSPLVSHLLFVSSIILQIIFVLSTPKTFELQNFQPLLYTILAGALVFIYTRFRWGLERERQAELRQTILALQKSEARWRSLVENAPEHDPKYRDS